MLSKQLGLSTLFYDFLAKRKISYLPFAFLPIYYFGTMGLFTFTWSGANVFAQLSHIMMTLNLLWAGYMLHRVGNHKATAQSLLWSILFFVPYIAFTMYYSRMHAEEINNLLQMTP